MAIGTSRMWMLVFVGLCGLVLGIAATIGALAAGVFDPPGTPPRTTAEWGAFPHPANVVLLEDGRTLRLTENFVYLDRRNKAWVARKDAIVDGASIPRVFWTIVGGPLAGKYRNASIVHDTGCVEMTERWEDVHLMFYEACRCGGLSENHAKLLYAAVYHFGPRWKIRPVFETRETMTPDGERRAITVRKAVAERVQETEEPGPEVREKLEQLIREQNPSLSELQALDPRAL